MKSIIFNVQRIRQQMLQVTHSIVYQS
jgi:hypothetical protein